MKINEDGSIEVTFKVNRALTPRQLLNATTAEGTDRIEGYINDSVLDAMPIQTGEGEEEVTLIFWNQGEYLSDTALTKERTRRGLTEDLGALFAYNALNPDFADKNPNGSSWKDADGKWCYACFNRWDDDRGVNVGRGGGGWGGDWWFAGRKVS